MAKKNVSNDTTEVVDTAPVDSAPVDTNEVLAYIVKDEDGDYRIEDALTGERGDKLTKTIEDGNTLCLSKNRANRHYASVKKLAEQFATMDRIPLTYRESKHFGSVGSKMPNEKLIAYLPEDLQAEYKAIIDRARAAYEAAKAKPMTDLEKAQAKLAKAQEAYEKLLAEASKEDK